MSHAPKKLRTINDPSERNQLRSAIIKINEELVRKFEVSNIEKVIHKRGNFLGDVCKPISMYNDKCLGENRHEKISR